MDNSEDIKACGWAKFIDKDSSCEQCPFGKEKCLYDLVDDCLEEFWCRFNEAYKRNRGTGNEKEG